MLSAGCVGHANLRNARLGWTFRLTGTAPGPHRVCTNQYLSYDNTSSYRCHRDIFCRSTTMHSGQCLHERCETTTAAMESKSAVAPADAAESAPYQAYGQCRRLRQTMRYSVSWMVEDTVTRPFKRSCLWRLDKWRQLPKSVLQSASFACAGHRFCLLFAPFGGERPDGVCPRVSARICSCSRVCSGR